MLGTPAHSSPQDRAALVAIDIQREYVDGALPLAGVHAATTDAGRVLDLGRRHGVIPAETVRRTALADAFAIIVKDSGAWR
jgi:hypothetical protein